MENQLKTLVDYFLEREHQHPDTPFLRQPYGNEWKVVTWKEAGEIARKMVAALQDMGLEKGDKIGIFSKNCSHWILADLAILLGGYVSTPFYPNLTEDQLKKVLALSDAKALFVGKLDEWDAVSGGIPKNLITIGFPHYPGNALVNAQYQWDDLISQYSAVENLPEPALDDLWTILFTSGTTGNPKGVMHTHRAPSALLENERHHGNLKLYSLDNHRLFSYLPLNHIAERIIVEVAAIVTGATISFAESLDTFAQNLQETRPTIFMGVPRIWSKFQLGILNRLPEKRLNLLLKLPVVNQLIRKKIAKGLGLDDARILLTGAAPTPDALKEWYERLGLRLQEVYAMTENCGGCTLMPPDHLKSGTVGKPLPNVEIKINEETGEVLMRAPWVMQGYYGDPDMTAVVLQDGWLHTGDQGYLDDEGFLCLTGRVSDTFKSAKGKYIVPAPIEWGFAHNHFIEQVCVLGLGVPQPLALVVLSELGAKEPRDVVRESLRETLAEVNGSLSAYQRIKTLVVMSEPWTVETGVLTPTMKIRRDVLNKQYHDQFEAWYQQSEPVIWENA